MNWRRLHRWVAIAAAVFLANLAITGTILAWSSITDARREARAGITVTRLRDEQLLPLLQSAYAVAQQATSNAPILSLRIGMGDGEPRAVAIIGGDHTGMLFIDPVRGQYLIGAAGAHAPGDARLDTHSFIKRLHRGDVVGLSGRYVVILAGGCLVFLLVSALVMYLQLRRARLNSGRFG